MPKKEVPEQTKVECAAMVVGMLNQASALLTGWVLQMDQEWVEKQLNPIYDKLDQV